MGRDPQRLIASALGSLGSFLRRGRPSRNHQWRDLAPCYLSVQDRNLRIIEANAMFRRDFGDCIGEHCYRAYKDRTSPCPECPVLKTFEDGENHTGEEVVITRDGARAQVLVTSTPFSIGLRGRPVSVLEMSTNITQVKALQQELDRSKSYFKQLFDIVPCYITLQDRDFRILESNKLFRDDFGDRTGERCYHAYKQRDDLCPGCPVQATFADGEVHSSEEEVITASGGRGSMIVYSMPVRGENGEIVSVMEVSTNITEVKRLQHELAMMGLAVAGMAHRVKNIVMGLEGGIFVVNTGMEEDDKGQISEGWEMVQRNVGKISRLVKDLLYCSREREPVYRAGVAPDSVLREVHELYCSRTEREGIALRLELEGPIEPGRYDPEGIHNLVANLVANAIDACRFDPDQGKEHVITIRCFANGGGITIQVRDNGPGIPEEQAERVFKGFFSTKGTEGTGLGLLVVRKVATEHGGTVTLDTAVGKGTTFTITLLPCAGGGTAVAAGRDPPAKGDP